MTAQKSNGHTSNGNARRGRPPKQSKARETNGVEAGGVDVEPLRAQLLAHEAAMHAELIAEAASGPRIELAAMEQVRQALEPLDEPARMRVLRWAGEAFGIE